MGAKRAPIPDIAGEELVNPSSRNALIERLRHGHRWSDGSRMTGPIGQAWQSLCDDAADALAALTPSATEPGK